MCEHRILSSRTPARSPPGLIMNLARSAADRNDNSTTREHTHYYKYFISIEHDPYISLNQDVLVLYCILKPLWSAHGGSGFFFFFDPPNVAQHIQVKL